MTHERGQPALGTSEPRRAAGPRPQAAKRGTRSFKPRRPVGEGASERFQTPPRAGTRGPGRGTRAGSRDPACTSGAGVPSRGVGGRLRGPDGVADGAADRAKFSRPASSHEPSKARSGRPSLPRCWPQPRTHAAVAPAGPRCAPAAAAAAAAARAALAGPCPLAAPGTPPLRGQGSNDPRSHTGPSPRPVVPKELPGETPSWSQGKGRVVPGPGLFPLRARTPACAHWVNLHILSGCCRPGSLYHAVPI